MTDGIDSLSSTEDLRYNHPPCVSQSYSTTHVWDVNICWQVLDTRTRL